MRQIILSLLLLLNYYSAAAQMHDNHWIFGYTYAAGNTDGTLLHFEKGYPEFRLENVRQDYFYYAIVCSDSAGNLIFHTDGRQLRNRLHQLMPGGEVINPGKMREEFWDGYPTLTGGMAIPAPGRENFYYLIHTTLKDGEPITILCPELLYTLIDMNANNGLGSVVEANSVIASGELPSPTLIKHGNGRDWWLVVGEYLSKTYLIYLIDPTGIHLVQQQAIAPASLTNESYTEASPDGKYFIITDSNTGLWIFDFDRCSGHLSNPRVLPYQPPAFFTSTLAFSPDSRFLYAGTHLVSYQVDMQSIDSETIAIDTIARYEYGASPAPPYMTHFFLPETAADGKIYYGTFNNSRAYHVINRPNLPLLAADMAQRGLELPKHNMMTRCYFPNYRLGRWEDAPCDSLAFAPGAEDRFSHIPWSENKPLRSTESIKVLKLPPGFNIPAATNEPPGEAFNPLNMKTIFRQELEKRKNRATENKTGQPRKQE
ncbi:MAG: hypothetical protein J0L99_18665 [Chitinophagales bacterium]|nr:hypothetical protein [Chitinophagales bacterium]